MWSRYRDANPVPTSPLADDITTAPSGPVISVTRFVTALRSALFQRKPSKSDHRGRKEMFYFTTGSTHFINCYMASDI